MAYRFTNTDKWNDAWFSNLKPIEKLLFIYLYENCDMAGFIELNQKRWSIDLGITIGNIEGALKGLGRGFIISESKDCIFLRTYLKHQKNLPLIPERNPAHRGIMKCFENYKYKFNIEDILKFIEGACQGLSGPLGNGNGNSKGNSIGKEGKEKNLEMRETIFVSEVYQYSEQYPKEMLQKFITYWTECNKSKTKMRFELEKTFEISKRLTTWASRDREFNKIISDSPKTYEEMLKMAETNPEIWKQYKSVLKQGERKAIFYPIKT